MDSRELMMRASDALAENDLKEAERLFLMASETGTPSHLAYYNLGILASDQERLEEALSYLEKAISLKADDADILTALGTVHLKAGREAEAEKMFRKALEFGESEVLYNNMGSLFFRRKDYNQAKMFFRRALDINPDYHEARENIALANFYLAMLT
ncbi:MAG: tetratricopeptide repeat protein [Spirochaetia bacterium]|nr:tetratricopeptide repeat protein [Spirochaetia bacterium]